MDADGLADMMLVSADSAPAIDILWTDAGGKYFQTDISHRSRIECPKKYREENFQFRRATQTWNFGNFRLNNDALPDFLLDETEYDDTTMFVVQNLGNRQFSVPKPLPKGISYKKVKFYDYDLDGDDDIIYWTKNCKELKLIENKATNFASAPVTLLQNVCAPTTLGEDIAFNLFRNRSSQVPDIILFDSLKVYRAFGGQYSLSYRLPRPINTSPGMDELARAVFFDVNQDGDQDMMINMTDIGKKAIYLQDSVGKLSRAILDAGVTVMADQNSLTYDANRDGIYDLRFGRDNPPRGGGCGKIDLPYGQFDPVMTFVPELYPTSLNHIGAEGYADVNGDGKKDAVFNNPTSSHNLQRELYLGNDTSLGTIEQPNAKFETNDYIETVAPVINKYGKAGLLLVGARDYYKKLYFVERGVSGLKRPVIYSNIQTPSSNSLSSAFPNRYMIGDADADGRNEWYRLIDSSLVVNNLDTSGINNQIRMPTELLPNITLSGTTGSLLFDANGDKKPWIIAPQFSRTQKKIVVASFDGNTISTPITTDIDLSQYPASNSPEHLDFLQNIQEKNIGDVDGDEKADLVYLGLRLQTMGQTASIYTDTVDLFISSGIGNGAFGPLRYQSLPNFHVARQLLGFEHLDGDGRKDILYLIKGRSADTLCLGYRRTNTQYRIEKVGGIGMHNHLVGLQDINRDGIKDIILGPTNCPSQRNLSWPCSQLLTGNVLKVCLGTALGGFLSAADISITSNILFEEATIPLALYDTDGDGAPEVISRVGMNNIGVLKNNFRFAMPVGVDDRLEVGKEKDTWLAYPNPTSNQITLRVKTQKINSTIEPERLLIFNAQGTKVLEVFAVRGVAEFSAKKLPPGAYNVRSSIGKVRLSSFIKQ